MKYSMALVGNPNVGKTSLFNRITKSDQHVGNWHGVTVESKTKQAEFENNTVSITDLPGLYSLTIYSKEEEISRDGIYQKNNDIIVNVCDACNLTRNLYLTLQLLEYGCPLVLAVNMMDELTKKGLDIDEKKLSGALNIPVVKMSAKYSTDTEAFIKVTNAFMENKKNGQNKYRLSYLDNLPVTEISSIIKNNAEKAGLDAFYCAIKLMENDSFVIDKLKLTDTQIKQLETFGDTQGQLAAERYIYIEKILDSVITGRKNKEITVGRKTIIKPVKLKKQSSAFSKIDKVVLNKYLALPIFIFIMLLIFFITFGIVGKFFSNTLELAIERFLYIPVKKSLSMVSCPAWITGLICDGIILGGLGVLAFLPQVVLLFFLLAILEDSGYISRVAFMTDGLFQKIGLSGRSVFTMLMGFGCSATAVLTARGLDDEMMRKKTVLLTPFFSCSAKLPVFSCIAAAFFTKGSTLIVFGMYVLGIITAIIIAVIFEKLIKSCKSGKPSFIMEMPPYRLPTFERILQLISSNVKNFIIRVGTVVFALNIIVWMLSNFSFTHGYVYGTEYKSILQAVGGFIAPVFAPLGFGSWKAVTGLLGGIVAKEVVISTIESMGGVQAVFTGGYASLSALSFMVFTLLYVPCIAALSAIRKESGVKWMFFTIIVQLTAAYLMSLAVYWTGRFFYANNGLFLGVILAAIIFIVCYFIIKSIVRKKSLCGYACANCDNSICAKVKK